MKKSTKGALAASAAGALLLGGAGSLAYWNSTTAINGSDIASGKLALTENECGDWQLDADGGDGGNLGNRTLVPGDTLSKVCTYTLTADGGHLAAKLDITTPSWTGGLAGKVTTTAAFDVDGTAVTPGSPYIFEDGAARTVTATFHVAFPFGTSVDNTSQGLSASLDDITLTATQVDSHSPS
jgi:alternate signal-mediated exported protein